MLCSSNSIAGTWMTNPIRISPTRRRTAQAGFTMMELLIGIAVLAILTTLAVPAFNQFIQNNRLAGQANEVVGALQFARSEALKRGTWAELCASTDQSSCGGNMDDGWIVHVDPASLGPDEENPLRVWSSPGDSLTFSTVAQNSARFEASGCFNHNPGDDGVCSAHFGAGNETPLFVVEEDPDIEAIQPRQIRISQTGRVSACRQDPDDATQCETN